MEVILLERIEKLGQMGDVVKVRPGFARNFLLPTRKAMRATEANRKVFEDKRAQLEADNLSRRQDAEAVAAKMEGLTLVLVRQAGETGLLYGSVSARDIAEAVTEAGFTVSRAQAAIERPIKALGIHEVKISLHPEVAVTISLNIAKSVEEAELQARRAAGEEVSEEREEAEAEFAELTEAPAEEDAPASDEEAVPAA